MRVPFLFLAFVLMFAVSSAQKSKPMYFGDASYTDFGKVTHLSDIFALTFLDSTGRNLTITDTNINKTLHISLDSMVYQRYVDASPLGIQDSVLVIVFNGRVNNLTHDKISMSFVYYKNSPVLHSICFGNREKYMIIKSKYDSNNANL